MIMMVPSDLKVYEYWPVSVSPPSHRTPLLISVTWAYSRGRTRLLFRPSSLRCYPKEPQPPPWYSPSSCPGLASGTSRASSCSGQQILRGGIPPKSRVAWLPFFFWFAALVSLHHGCFFCCVLLCLRQQKSREPALLLPSLFPLF